MMHALWNFQLLLASPSISSNRDHFLQAALSFPIRKAETLLSASMFVVSENSERADVRNATNRNDWGCLNGWSDC